MRDQKKHGVFAAMEILTGEDPKGFEKLHSDLMEELAPAGAIEEDAVLRIAKAVWRKRRVQNFLAVQLLRNSAAGRGLSAQPTTGRGEK
jgi:hypothetical protein